MKLTSVFARGAAALALAGLIGAVHAGGADSNTTLIKLMGKDKKLETLRFEGELEVGASRGLYTDAGTPVTVRRTEKGLSIETPERNVDVPYPSAAELADGGTNVVMHGDGAHKKVIVLKHGEEGALPEGSGLHKKRVIVVKDGEAGNTDVDLDVRLGDLADLDVLTDTDVDVHVDHEGHEKVVVIRKVIKHDEAEAAQ